MLERDNDVKWQQKKAPYATWQRTYLYLNCAWCISHEVCITCITCSTCVRCSAVLACSSIKELCGERLSFPQWSLDCTLSTIKELLRDRNRLSSDAVQEISLNLYLIVLSDAP